VVPRTAGYDDEQVSVHGLKPWKNSWNLQEGEKTGRRFHNISFRTSRLPVIHREVRILTGKQSWALPLNGYMSRIPQRIIACPGTCDRFRSAAMGASVEIQVGCKTVIR
jgi:hypothetical protein